MKVALILVAFLLSGICALNLQHNRGNIVRRASLEQRDNVPDQLERSFAQAMAARSFYTTAMLTTPVNQYIDGVFITTLSVENSANNIQLQEGESLTDFCIHVQLNVNLQDSPLSTFLPASYMNFRVFYSVGTTILLSGSGSADSGEYVCPAIAVMCADGSYTGLSGPECKPSCPEEAPVGGVPIEDVTRISYDFFAKYSDKNYFMLQTNTLDQEDLSAITLTANESPSDYCIDVTFFAEPDQSYDYPTVYQGVRVFYKTSRRDNVCQEVLMICADGTPAQVAPDCTQYCTDSQEIDDATFMNTFLFCMVASFTVSLLCCCCRMCIKRKISKCSQRNGFHAVPTSPSQPEIEIYYPAEQYEFTEQQMMMPPNAVPVMAPQQFMPPQHPFMMPPNMMTMDPTQQPPYFHPMFAPQMVATPQGYVMMMPHPFPPQLHEESPAQQ